jgi:hypothetical protein
VVSGLVTVGESLTARGRRGAQGGRISGRPPGWKALCDEAVSARDEMARAPDGNRGASVAQSAV